MTKFCYFKKSSTSWKVLSIQVQFNEGHKSQAWEFWLPPANTFILCTHTNFTVKYNNMQYLKDKYYSHLLQANNYNVSTISAYFGTRETIEVCFPTLQQKMQAQNEKICMLRIISYVICKEIKIRICVTSKHGWGK